MNRKSSQGTQTNLRRNAVAQACVTFTMLMAAGASQAGGGWGVITNTANQDLGQRTYYAHTPSGVRTNAVPIKYKADGTVAAVDPRTDPLVDGDTGAALQKFIDPLPGLYDPTAPNAVAPANGKYIPKAVVSKWVSPNAKLVNGTPVPSNDDYYAIAVVDYKEKLHSNLANPTTLRGYVQIDEGASNGRAALPGSLSYPLTHIDGSAILIPATKADGTLDPTANKGTGMVPALAVDKPHYLGPAIVATKGVAVRLKFFNLLPAGTAGNLPIPVDTTLPGAGLGPDGATLFSQNRAEVHLHGGDTPWISDGTPHQWITPAGELDPAIPGSIANLQATTTFPTADDFSKFIKGASQQNVPDMPDPGVGAATYYYPNNQSGRLMFYHDHTFGLTRLNVYMGEAAPYVIADPEQNAIFSAAGLPTDADAIPLVIQDKTFVPKDIAVQDGLWNNLDVRTNPDDIINGVAPAKAPMMVWGGESDLWYPHVYEVNQDPIVSIDGTNPVGRWDWGPYFWPVFPSLYNLPVGGPDDVTITPEAWMDTPLVNGVAYPTMNVPAAPVRFKILNAANDRMLNLSMFVADDTIAQGQPGYLTEVKMTPAVPVGTSNALPGSVLACGTDLAGKEIPPTITAPCWPSYWPTDGRDGGVPDPTTVGPAWYQIGSEGGLLPQVATIQPSPMGYEYNRRSVTVLNTFTYGLFMGNAERADVVVDFSQYAGKTLILYSDAPAPVPAFDPRNDHWTGKPDETNAGSVESPKPGYGPNTRTIMQINVDANGGVNGTALDVAKLETALETAYKATQEAPIVGQSYYNAAIKPTTPFTDVANTSTGSKAYATIATGSLQEPAFKFVPGDSNAAFGSIAITLDANGNRIAGEGYQVAPPVTITGPTGSAGATANATLRISDAVVTNPGSGYIVAPLVNFTNQTGINMTDANGNVLKDAAGNPIPYPIEGTGATAYSTLKVVGLNQISAGTGYVAGDILTLNFAPPTNPSPSKGGVTAKGQINVTNVNGALIYTPVITEPGYGYASVPGVTVSGGSGKGAKYASVGGVGAVIMTSPNAKNQNLAGGSYYNDLRFVNVTFTAPPAGTTATAIPYGSVSDISLTSAGSGYDATTTVSLALPKDVLVNNTNVPLGTALKPADTLKIGNVAIPLQKATSGGPLAPWTVSGALATTNAAGSLLVKSKAIQELFDPTYGRMNATLGIELPFTSALNQTTIPLGYVDPTSEEFNDGETQIWKITHNGVDSHPVHFHLVNVQVINRIGWDGTIKPPQDNERGWKETVKFHPLEDLVVALRAKKPKTGFDYWNAIQADGTFDAAKIGVTPAGVTPRPGGYGTTIPALAFGVPLSERPRDPSQPLHVLSGFTQIDPATGLPATITNEIENYGWEYVWHCHILGHEENDFMRPVKFNANEAAAAAPLGLAATTYSAASPVKLTWTDVASSEYKYQVIRKEVVAAGAVAATTPAVDLLANANTYSDATAAPGGNVLTYIYDVSAVGVNGTGMTSVAMPVDVAAPTIGTVVAKGANGATLSWTDNSVNETQFVVQISADGGVTWTSSTPSSTSTVATGGVQTFDFTGLTPLTTYKFQVFAQLVTKAGTFTSPVSAPVDYTVPFPPPAAPTLTRVNPTSALGVAVRFTDNATNETNSIIQTSTGAVTANTQWANAFTLAGTAGTGTVNQSLTANTLTLGQLNNIRVVATNAGGQIASNVYTIDATNAVAPAAATLLTAVEAGTTTATYRNISGTFTAPATPATSTGLSYSFTVNGTAVAPGSVTVGNGSFTLSNVIPVTGGGSYAVAMTTSAGYTLTGVSTGTPGTAAVTVAAANGSGLTAFNVPTYAAPVWNAVPTATANATGSRSITVNWTAVTSGLSTSYQLQRSTTGTGNWQPVGTATTGLTATAGNLTAGTRYYFRVVATNGLGSSTSGIPNAVAR